MCTKFIGKVTTIRWVMSRRRRHICKWAFLQVPSLILRFQSTLPLVMRIVKGKNNTGGNQTEKLITDPTLDFNKRLNMQALNKKYCEHFQKSMILKPSKKEFL